MSSEVPEATLAWAARVGGGRLAAIEQLEGGVQAYSHALDLELPDGSTRSVVLRRFDPTYPWAASYEANHLAGLAGSGLPVAELVGADLQAVETDRPATLQTRLRGRVNLDPDFVLPRLDQLAHVLSRIHETPYAAIRELVDYRTFAVAEVNRDPHPALAALPGGAELWLRARERVASLSYLEKPVLLHSDFHIANVIWDEGRLSGVVDWSSAGIGDRAKDVAYCRMDLSLVFGGDAHERFLGAYVEATGFGAENIAFWDLYYGVMALTEAEQWAPGWHALGRHDLTMEVIRARVRAFLDSLPG